MTKHTRKHINGFTLVELIVVIVLLAIVLGTGGTMLVESFKSAFVSRDLIDANWQARLAFERIVRDLHAAESPSLITLAQSGTRLEITDTEGNTVKYRIASNGYDLKRKEPATDGGEILATGISTLDFNIYDKNGAAQATPDADTRYIQVLMTFTHGGTNLSLQTVVYPQNF